MRTIIAGGRDVTDDGILQQAILDCGFAITEVVCGGAKGADELGKVWAEANGIAVKLFPADWRKHGRAAGPIRNREMADYAEALIALWDGESKGTRNMIELATSKSLLVHVHRLNQI